MPNVAFWQEDVAVSPPAALPTIAWDTDQLTGEEGRWWSEVPQGSEASASGVWTDDDASASEPIQDIWLTLRGNHFANVQFSDPTATSGTWSVSTTDFLLTDDAYPVTVNILDFNGNLSTAQVQFFYNHNNPQQTLQGHPNGRQDSDSNYWAYIFSGNPTNGGSIPNLFQNSAEFMYRVPTNGYGVSSYIQPAANAMIETLKATAANGYAGRAVKPQWQVAIPPGVQLVIEQAVVSANGSTLTNEQTHTFDGPIEFTGNPTEINVSIPKIDLELDETIRLRIYTVGSDPFDFNTLGVYGYANHLNVSQAVTAPVNDPMGLYIDPVNGDDSTGVFGDMTKPYKSYWPLSTNAYMDSLPTGTAANPINVYQPRGTVAEFGDGSGSPTGDSMVLKRNVFHMQPWPDTYGQAPTIRGHANFPLTSGDATYGKQNVGLLTLRDCTDSIVEQFIIEDSRTGGIMVEVDQETTYGTSTCRGNRITSCIIRRTGADGFIARGRGNPAGNDVFTTNPVEDTTVEYMDIYEANYAYTGPISLNVVTGQAFTVSHGVGFYGHHINLYDFVKEGFDVISSRNVLLEDMYAIREPLGLYGTQRGTSFYSDAQGEGNYNVVFRRGLSERNANGLTMGSEAAGPSVGVVFESLALRGNTGAAMVIGGQEYGSNPTYTDSAIRNCTALAEGNQFGLVSSSTGDISTVDVSYNIIKGNRQNLIFSFNGIYPALNKNCIYTTNASGLTGERGTNSLEVDPLLVSDTDLRLQSGSPCINLINQPIRSADAEGSVVEFLDSYGAYTSAPVFDSLDDIGDLILEAVE